LYRPASKAGLRAVVKEIFAMPTVQQTHGRLNMPPSRLNT
jgi:hypothetical protein